MGQVIRDPKDGIDEMIETGKNIMRMLDRYDTVASREAKARMENADRELSLARDAARRIVGARVVAT